VDGPLAFSSPFFNSFAELLQKTHGWNLLQDVAICFVYMIAYGFLKMALVRQRQ
jgi:hypothetical protein